jgi:hypothetical protein
MFGSSLPFENTEGAIKKDNPHKTGNIGYTRRRKTKQKHNTIYVGLPLYVNEHK